MQAMILTSLPQAWQASMSILNTRLKRCAQVMDARRSADVGGSSDPLAWFPLPRFAGVTNARYLTMRRKHAVESRKIHARFWHQRRQSCNEVQRLEDDVGGASR